MQQRLFVRINLYGWLCFVASVLGAGCTGSGSDKTSNGDGTSDSHAQGGNAATPPNPKAGELAPTSLVRRLSQDELDNTLQDVLGDTTRPARKFLVEDEFKPFDNNYGLQTASRSYTDNLRELARDVATRTLADPQTRMKVLPCQPSGAADTTCFRAIIETLGRRLLRRPLAAVEVDAYMPLQKFATEVNAAAPHDFYTAVQLVLRALLQDPEFFNRVETGRQTNAAGVYALDSFAIGTRMSYLLWGSTPDEELLSSATQDGLITANGRLAQLDRMLKAPRARTQQHRFFAQWLGYRTIPHAAATAAMFSAETSKLLDSVIFDSSASFLDVFTSPRTYVTTALAAHYGLPAPEGGAGWVQYPAASGRAGILSHGSVLAAFSKFSDTSPTQRGILVQTRLMCNEILSPPATINVDQPPGNPDQECKTARYQAHMDQSGCKACHMQMDPIGFGLENYDVAGKFRTTDSGKPSCNIAGQGEIPDLGAFMGPKALADKLVAAGEISDCMVRHYLTFALGRNLQPDEEALVTTLKSALTNNGNRLTDMFRSLVADPAFALRTLPEAP